MGYIALYQNVTKEVRQNCGRVAQQVLLELANYADCLGICWPGLARLGTDTGYSVETVQNGLQALIDQDYIRVHYRWSNVRQRWEFEAYQLSPLVLVIREELQSQALRSYDYCNTTEAFVSKDSQPTTEPSLKNQRQEPTKAEPTTTTMTPEMEKSAESTTPPPFFIPPVTTEKSQKKQGQKSAAQAATPPAPTGATQNIPPHSAAPPPAKLSYAPFVNQLEDEAAEDCALDVWSATAGSMPMPVARYLVASRGVKVCRAALKNYSKNSSRIDNPGGYVRALIERSQIDPSLDGIGDAPSAADEGSWF